MPYERSGIISEVSYCRDRKVGALVVKAEEVGRK